MLGHTVLLLSEKNMSYCCFHCCDLSHFRFLQNLQTFRDVTFFLFKIYTDEWQKKNQWLCLAVWSILFGSTTPLYGKATLKSIQRSSSSSDEDDSMMKHPNWSDFFQDNNTPIYTTWSLEQLMKMKGFDDRDRVEIFHTNIIKTIIERSLCQGHGICSGGLWWPCTILRHIMSFFSALI